MRQRQRVRDRTLLARSGVKAVKAYTLLAWLRELYTTFSASYTRHKKAAVL